MAWPRVRRPNGNAKEGADVANTTPAALAPREGTKISRVVGLLQRDNGATLDEVIAATGWLPHTSRAALTGLRKRGYAIEKHRSTEGRRGYIIAAAPRGERREARADGLCFENRAATVSASASLLSASSIVRRSTRNSRLWRVSVSTSFACNGAIDGAGSRRPIFLARCFFG